MAGRGSRPPLGGIHHLLAESTSGAVAEQAEGPFGPAASVLSWLGGFDMDAAWQRFRSCPFRHATLEDPYPNLRQ